jgi:hypothetical protein
MKPLLPARRRWFKQAGSFALLAGGPLVSAWAAATTKKPPAEVLTALTDARYRGSGKLTFLRLHVYDARLWVLEGFTPENYEQQPLALELLYARSLKGELIAERSLAEMRRVSDPSGEQAEQWLSQMRSLFPNVVAGDRITGIQTPGESTRFFLNGQLRGEVRDADFTRAFFSIWLSPRTSEPKLRQALLHSRVMPSTGRP